MSGKILRGRWPETPPPTDDDYFGPHLEEASDSREAGPEAAREKPSAGEKGPKLVGRSAAGGRDGEGVESNDGDADNAGGGSSSQADKAAAFGNECDLFADEQDADAIYADIVVNHHRETLRVRSGQFREWLRFKYFAVYRKGLKADIVSQAVETIAAHAKYRDERKSAPVFQRSARVGDRIYLDLCNQRWEAVEIDRDGWRVVAIPEVHFCRTRGMLPIPTPSQGGRIETLRPLLNVRTDADFVLIVAWLLHALGGVPPYPLLPLGGEQGTGKSTIAEILRTLIDPNKLPLRAMPQKEDDLFVSAARSHVAVFDNLSTIPGWTSDALCRLADGSGLGKRTLYTDDDETLIMAASPIILTAIGEVVSRPDLADRGVFATLELIREEDRRQKKALMAEFERARPAILGALLNALSHGLRTAREVRLSRLPRMADFAMWATACEGALWSAGTFMKAYTENRSAAVEAVLEADELACVVRRWLARPAVGGRWEGTCTDLLRILNAQADQAGTGSRSRAKEWPSTASGLSNRLRKIAPGLRAIGIETMLGARTSERRTVSFTPGRTSAETPSSPSSPSQEAPATSVDDGDDDNDGDSGTDTPRSGSDGWDAVDPDDTDESDGSGEDR